MKRLFIYISIFFFLISGQIFSQFSTDLQNIDQEIITLRSQYADLFFGKDFKEIIEQRSSLETLADNDNWTVYQEEFETALENIQSLKIASEKATKDFTTLLVLRQRAILLGAEAYGTEFFEKAEFTVLQTGDLHRDRQMSQALQMANKARKLYQQAEAEAIRNNLIGQVRIIISEADDYQAKTLAPTTYKNVKSLLHSVEGLIRENQFESTQLPLLSEKLLNEANYLLSLSKTLHYLARVPAAAESYVRNLETHIGAIAEQLDYRPRFEEGFEKVLQDLNKTITTLAQENRMLAAQNTALVDEKVALEQSLLKYKSLAAQEKFLHQKIIRARSAFKDNGKMEKQGSFLTIYVDSLNWRGEETTLSPENKGRLLNLAKALNEFPGHPVIIRYIQLSIENSAFQQTLAAQRAESIRSYIQSLPLFRGKRLQAIGVNSTDRQALSGSSHVEVLIDLTAYLSFDDRNNGQIPSNKTSE